MVYTLTYRNTSNSPVSATIVDDYDQAHGSPQAIGGSPHFAPGVANGDTITWGPAVVPPGGTGSWYIPVLTDYLRAGHGVLLVGGSDAPEVPDRHHAFLRQFGIEFQPHTVVSEDTLRAFASHPITAGVDALYVLNPTPITVLGPGPVVLCQQYDDPWPLPGEPQTLIWLVALDLP